MQAEIITIGDEILIGQTIDTNSAWMGKQLNKIGIDVHQISSIRDRKDHILEALETASKRSQIVLITGGLGPTNDDITKHTLCAYFNTRLVRNQEVLERITRFFTERGREMLEINAQQADLPENCTIVPNLSGTASGMWFEKDETVYVSMPGVPYEMKALMKESILSMLQKRFSTPEIYYRTVLTQGMGESFLAEDIKDWEDALRNDGLSLAYLPSPGIVKLRVSAKGLKNGKDSVEKYIALLHERIPHLIYGYNKETFPELIGKELTQRKATLSTAESCTSGNIAQQITSVPGSSAYYIGSVLSYANRIKEKELGVKENILIEHGAVSEQVVRQMAEGVKAKFNTDYAIATSGIMGPGGGSETKPVGTVWIAVSGPNGTRAQRFQLGNHRGRNVQLASVNAFHMLLKIIRHKKE